MFSMGWIGFNGMILGFLVNGPQGFYSPGLDVAWMNVLGSDVGWGE